MTHFRITLLWVTLLPMICWAHSDPIGDLHPTVVVENDHFSVYFRNNEKYSGYGKGEAYFRVRFSPDGDIVAPRHPVPEKDYVRPLDGLLIDRFHSPRPTVRIPQPDRTFRIKPLLWPPGITISMCESATLSPGHIAAAVKHEDNREDFFLYVFPRKGFVHPKRFLIGQPETIYDFPTASNVIFANGKFRIAYVHRGEMLLTSIDPDQEKPTSQILDTPGNWNSTLSLAAIGNRLCLAHHSSEGMQYPGKSSIYTIFVEAD